MATRLSSPAFVGRRAELTQLQAAAERAVHGKPGVVLVAGEAGVGKTRLVDELAAWARERGYHVLIGGCVSLSAEVAPFAPIVEALRPVIRGIPQAEVKAVLGPGVHGLAPLMPDIATLSQATDSTGISPDTGHGRVLELLLGMLGRLAAQKPIVLVVEDVHWADRSTIDVLAFLSRNIRSERILLVATYRTDEPGSRRRLVPVVSDLGRQGRTERIDLPRFNRAEMAQQLSAILGAPAASALIEGVYTRSQGNAFFSEELLAAGAPADALPQTLHDVLLARIGALSHDARELVRVASAAGMRFPEAMLARLTDAREAAFVRALREAIDQQILVRAAGPNDAQLGFRHSLVQALLYADLLPSERIRLHAECARVIEEQTSAESGPVLASELAHHWLAADEPMRALHASFGAAMAAEAAGARAEAAVQFERVLELLDGAAIAEGGSLPLDRVGLLERAAANRQDDPLRAVEHISEAVALVDAGRDPVRAGLLYAALGRYRWFSGDGAGALEACHEAMRLVAPDPPSEARARVAAGLGQILMILAHWEEAVPLCEEAVHLASATGARAIESHALNTLGILTAYLGEIDRGLAMLRQALEIATGIGSVDDADRANANLVDVLLYPAGRYGEAGDVGEEALGPADAPNATGLVGALLHAEVAAARYLSGRWRDAQGVLDRARLQPTEGAAEIALGIRAAQLHVGRGEFELADRQVEVLTRLLTGAVDTQWIAPFTAARAELAIWKGDPKESLRAVTHGLQRVHTTFGANVSRIGPMLALGVRAAADLAERTRVGRTAAVGEWARAQGADHVATMRTIRDQIASRWPAHLRIGDPYLALCEAEATRLEGTSDPDAWKAAADLLHDVTLPYAGAYARYREGAALLSARRGNARARSALRESYDTAMALGATPLRTAIESVAQRGRVEIAAGRARHGSSAGPAGLTAREQEILALVTAGLTNRQIGERLFITEKTASHHVSNILGKLAVSTRAEAAAEGVRLRIAPPR